MNSQNSVQFIITKLTAKSQLKKSQTYKNQRRITRNSLVKFSVRSQKTLDSRLTKHFLFRGSSQFERGINTIRTEQISSTLSSISNRLLKRHTAQTFAYGQGGEDKSSVVDYVQKGQLNQGLLLAQRKIMTSLSFSRLYFCLCSATCHIIRFRSQYNGTASSTESQIYQ